MALDERQQAWNRMVNNCGSLALLPPSDIRHAVGVAGLFMCEAGNSGLNGFLSVCSDIDARDAIRSLERIGATAAAAQLAFVVDGLGTPLRPSTSDTRETLLSECWPEDWGSDEETLTAEAESELNACLEAQVAGDLAFYLGLPAPEWPDMSDLIAGLKP